MYETTHALLGAIEQQQQNARESNAVGPSDSGRCIRQIGYRISGAPLEPLDDDSRNDALIGTLIHKGITDAISSLYDPTVRASEVRVHIPGLRDGAADDVWWEQRTIIDYKTKSARAFEWLGNRLWLDAVDEKEKAQVDVYAYALNGAHGAGTIRTCRLAYICRDTGETREIEWEYVPADGERAWRALRTMHETVTSVDVETLPREGAGIGLGFPCDWCPFRARCWQIDTVPAPRGAVSQFTPDEAVASLVADYIVLGAEATKATQRRKEVREQLVGIEYEDADFTLRWTGGKETEVVEVDDEALLTAAVRAGVKVPMHRVHKRSPLTIRAKAKTARG